MDSAYPYVLAGGRKSMDFAAAPARLLTFLLLAALLVVVAFICDAISVEIYRQGVLFACILKSSASPAKLESKTTPVREAR